MASSLAGLKAAFYTAVENGDYAQVYTIAQTPTFAKGDIIAFLAKTRRMFYANSSFGGAYRHEIYQILLDLTPLKVAFDEAVETQNSDLILAVINHFKLDFDAKGLNPDLSQRVLQLNFSPDIPQDFTVDDFTLYGSWRQSLILQSMQLSVGDNGITGRFPIQGYVNFFNS